MPTIHWTLPEGRTVSADVPEGVNLMTAATQIDIPYTLGECGGCLSCATCHVYVDDAWAERVGPATGNETGMLDFSEAPRQDNSRLSCQIIASVALDGLVLHIPGGAT